MTVVAAVERLLPLRYLRTSDIESDTISCEVGGVPVGCWVETVSLSLGSCIGSCINICINLGHHGWLAILAQAGALLLSLLESSGELLLSD